MTSHSRLPGRAWRLILEDLDLYALVVAGVLFGILGVSGIADVKDLSSVTLGGLTLLAFSQVRSRRLLSASKIQGVAFMTHFPEELYARRASESTEYIFVGKGAFRTVSTGRSDFQAMLDRGARLRFLLMDPNDAEGLRIAVESGLTGASDVRTAERIRGSIAELSQLRVTGSAKLEVRLLRFPPAFGVNGFSLSSRNGKLFIQQFVGRESGEQGPIYSIDARDEYWFNHYVVEIERLWAAGRRWGSE